jgi:hypothetical protein
MPQGNNWVLFEMSREDSANERELLECAQRVWPIACASGRRQINTETSAHEKDRLIHEAWEYVLFAIARAWGKGCFQDTDDLDLDAYLMKSFQHRLGRLMKIERMHQRLFTCADHNTLEMLAPASNDAETNLLRRLLVQEVVARMDGWTREVWGYLLGGSSWAWIANRFGMSKAQAKMRYRYYLYKLRLSLAQDAKDDRARFKSGQSAA